MSDREAGGLFSGIPARPVLVLAAAFFLVVQLWMSWVIWERKSGEPPEPDDSYFYILGIDLVNRYGSLVPDLPAPRYLIFDSGMSYATYNLALGGAARLLRVRSQDVYYWSFFAGKLLLLVGLLFFLSRFRLSLREQAGALIALAPYAGSPSTATTHGFFWVVPSFWLFLAFLLLAVRLQQERQDRLADFAVNLLLGLVFFSLHTLSLWAGVVLILFVLLAAWQSGRVPAFLRPRLAGLAGFGLGIVLGEVISYAISVRMGVAPASAAGQVLGLFQGAGGAGDVPDTLFWRRLVAVLPSSWLIWGTYFSHVVLIPPYVLLLAWTTWREWRRRQEHLHLLFLATVAGVVAATAHPFGHRTVMFLWPLTLMLMVVGGLRAGAGITARFPRARAPVEIVFTLFLLGVTLTALSQTGTFLRGFAAAADDPWDRRCAADLLAATDAGSFIEYADKFAYAAFLAHGLVERPVGTAEEYARRRRDDPAYHGAYYLVASSRPIITSDQVGNTLGEPLTTWRTCGAFTIWSLRPRR